MKFLKKRLPTGYSIITWKNANGEKRYSVFKGDDRLMSFNTKAEAINYAISANNKKP